MEEKEKTGFLIGESRGVQVELAPGAVIAEETVGELDRIIKGLAAVVKATQRHNVRLRGGVCCHCLKRQSMKWRSDIPRRSTCIKCGAKDCLFAAA